MLQAAGDPGAAHCRRIEKTAAAWERGKHKSCTLTNFNRPVRLTSPIFTSPLHKTTTLPSRGPSSLVWVGPVGVYCTVPSGRRPCAWGRANAPGTSENQENLNFWSPRATL